MTANESSGTTHRERWFDGFCVSEVTHRAGLELPRHEHEHACLHVVLTGCYQETTGAGEAALEAGHSLWKPAGWRHANHFVAGARTLRVEFLQAETQSGPVTSNDPRLHVLARRLAVEIARDDDVTVIGGEALVVDMCGLLDRRRLDPAPAPVVAECAELLSTRACRAELRLSAVAGELRCDRAGLARTFHRTYGCTMGDWVRQQRVAAAMSLLMDPTMPLAAVAQRAGFADQSHFSRVFRALVGTTPGVFRRS